MPTLQSIEVKKLSIDLNNFRTTKQKNETDAIKAMISIKPEKFFAVMDSLIEDGYLLTESIQVLKTGKILEVKEGNRRVGALKIILGIYKIDNFNIPSSTKEKIKNLTKEWKKENASVPCTIYDITEIATVKKVVSMTHGKAEKAGRDPWNSVARARYSRDEMGRTEFGLNMLEKYLKQGQNLSAQQKERWGGEYYVTVLDEAMRRLHTRMGYSSVEELVKKYPRINFRSEFEELMRDIGLEQLGFPTMRNTQIDFGIHYGINPPPPPPTPGTNTGGQSGTSVNNGNTSGTTTSATGNSGTGGNSSSTGGQSSGSGQKAHSSADPKSVKAVLKKFTPKGNDREKIVALRDELRNLVIDKNPIAFCFLLRSMFEISAKLFCKENQIPTKKPKVVNGKTIQNDKSLKELLQGVTNHLTANKKNKEMVKLLHGAMTELKDEDRLLSVTSMNQLVHSETFSVGSSDICRLFHRVYPLLEQMN